MNKTLSSLVFKIPFNWVAIATTLIVNLSSCKSYIPIGTFQEMQAEAVDYSQIDKWAAHPSKKDLSDETPERKPAPKGQEVGIFFLHPTTYTGDKGQTQWNAPIDQKKLNDKTDKSAILFQASAWNHAGPVFAPYYRQAHIHVYFSEDRKSSLQALNIAYGDVKLAFQQFLKEIGEKPFIIASHSQGSTHAIRLIKDLIDGKPLQNKLVAAYLIGMPVSKSEFAHILPCQDPDDIHCFISWRTYLQGYTIPSLETGNVLVTNPLSWKIDNQAISASENQGTLLYDFYELKRGLVSAQVSKDILWANKPKFRGSYFYRSKNFHIADINFYYASIRQNAVDRSKSYFKNQKMGN
jgi:hypothetical protein